MNKIASLSAALLFAAGRRGARVRRPRRASRSRADPSAGRRVAAARRAQLRQLLPDLPQREIHALRAPHRHRPDRAADQGQPDVRDRQDRFDDDGRDDSPPRRRTGSARAPPDLSVEARIRGSDWLYNYFLAFYRDDQTTTGWNNLVFPNVAMPHVLVATVGPGQAGRRPNSKATRRRSRRPSASRGSRNSNRPRAANGS